MVGLALLVELGVELVLLEVLVGHLAGLLVLLAAFARLLPEVLVEALGLLVADVALDGDSVDLGQEVGLVDMWVFVGAGGVVLEEDLPGLQLLVVEQRADLLHVDDAVDLSSGELAETVLATGVDALLIHPTLLPVLRQVLLLRLLLQEGLPRTEAGSVDLHRVGRHAFGRNFGRGLRHFSKERI